VTPKATLQLATPSPKSVANDPFLAGQVFRDYLHLSRKQNNPIPDKLRKLGSHIAHEFFQIFRVNDVIATLSWKGGHPQL
jgi:hypothetical protein